MKGIKEDVKNFKTDISLSPELSKYAVVITDVQYFETKSLYETYLSTFKRKMSTRMVWIITRKSKRELKQDENRFLNNHDGKIGNENRSLKGVIQLGENYLVINLIRPSPNILDLLIGRNLFSEQKEILELESPGSPDLGLISEADKRARELIEKEREEALRNLEIEKVKRDEENESIRKSKEEKLEKNTRRTRRNI